MDVKQEKMEQALGAPAVRLAYFDIPAVDAGLSASHAPALLVSYVYVEPFLKARHLYCYRDWVLDSGAFSAHNSGTVISLSRYTDFCLRLLAEDPTLTEVFALDVIPKDQKPAMVARAAEQSEANCAEMWRQGVPAIPCFHRGEPEEFLLRMSKEYPKVALGGVALERGDAKFHFLNQCFARIWPKRVHGFGMAGEDLVYGLPFHSVDATNWELAPCAFGNWQKFGQMSVRGSNQDLRSQVRHYLDVEAKARVRWAKEMALLETLPKSGPCCASPVERLAMRSTGRELVGAGVPSGPHGRRALDASRASGNRAETILGGATKSKPTELKKVSLPGEMEDKWKDYWKNR